MWKLLRRQVEACSEERLLEEADGSEASFTALICSYL